MVAAVARGGKGRADEASQGGMNGVGGKPGKNKANAKKRVTPKQPSKRVQVSLVMYAWEACINSVWLCHELDQSKHWWITSRSSSIIHHWWHCLLSLLQRILKAREPKIVEDAKNALLLKGTKCPEAVQTVLRDLVSHHSIDWMIVMTAQQRAHDDDAGQSHTHARIELILFSPVICKWISYQTRLLKPNAKMLSRKNEIRPFEDATSLEFLMDKNDCALFAFGNHSKKRPQNLIMVSRCRRLIITIHSLDWSIIIIILHLPSDRDALTTSIC